MISAVRSFHHQREPEDRLLRLVLQFPDIWSQEAAAAFQELLVLLSADELCEPKEDKPSMLADTLTAKERESMEEKEEPEGNGEKGQQEEEMEVKERESEEEDQGEEEDLEELRAQVLQLLLELDETREVSQRHEESFMELQGEKLQDWSPVVIETPLTHI